VTVLGLDIYHFQKHGYYDKLAHGSVYNTIGLMKIVHGGFVTVELYETE
jgi:hypothetical protein